MKPILSLILFTAILSVPEVALAKKKFKANDYSKNNQCEYVYRWFKKTKEKHAVFVTSGGDKAVGRVTEYGYCQAGGASTLKEATYYAVTRCNREALRRLKKPKRCKVVESR